MSVFDLDERESLAALNTPGVRLDQVEPEFGYRTAYGFGMGIMKGGARVAQAVGLAGAAIPIAVDKVTGGTRAQDAYFGTYEAVMQNAADYWTPRAEEVGTAGKLLGGLAEMALPLMAGAGNPALLLAGQGMGMGVDLAREGVDPYAAVAVGTVQAAATAGGFAIPFLGRNLLQRVGLGAAGNLATNIPADFASQEVLRAAGANEQAARFDPFSLEARTLDIVAGGAFGAVGHLLARGTLTEDDARAAWAASRNAKNFQQDSAPRPLDTPEQSIAHQAAMEAALQQLARGETVRVPPAAADGIDGVTQTPRPEMVAALREVLQQDRALDRAIAQAEETRASLIAEAGNLADPGAIRLARDELALMEQQRPDTSEAGIKALAKQIQADEGVSYKAALSQAKKQTAAASADFDARAARLQDAIAANAKAEQARQGLAVVDRQIADLQAQRAEIDAPPLALNPVAAAVQDLAGQPLGAVLQAPGVRALRALAGVDPDAPPMAARAADAPASEGGKGLAAQLPEIEAARAVVARLPDTAVKLEDGTEVRASDLLARVEAEVRQAEVEAKSFSAAVQCFLGR